MRRQAWLLGRLRGHRMGTAQMAAAQATPYPAGDVQKTYERLLKEIDKIPMYDNHAHPGFADDTDVDAMAAPPDESATLRLRDDNPEFVAGAKALFGYPYDDFKPEHAKWLADKKAAAEKAGGTRIWTFFGQIERGHLPGESRDDGAVSRYRSAFTGYFSATRFSIPSTTAPRRPARRTWACTCRCRKKCSRAGKSRKAWKDCRRI